MNPQKFRVAIAVFTYGGSSCAEWLRPEIAEWFVDAAMYCRDEPRISELVGPISIATTPLSYGRNLAFKKAREAGADFLLMMDNDLKPDSRVGLDSRARPFLPAAFNFLADRYHLGPHVVAGPYMCVDDGAAKLHAYRTVSRLGIDKTDPAELDMAAVTRHEAAISTGFEPMVSSIIGWSLSDIRVKDLLGPTGFHHEYDDHHEVRVGTEDLSATRDMVLAAQAKGLPHPLYMNWDGWAGHYKVVMIDKPQVLEVDTAVRSMRAAIEHATEKDVHRVYVDEQRGMLAETNGKGALVTA